MLSAQEATQLNPEVEKHYQTIIKSLAQDHDVEKAKATLVLIVKSNPNYPKPRYNLGLIAASEHHWTQALQWMGQYRDMVDDTHRAKADKIITSFRLRQGIEFKAAMISAVALAKAGKIKDAASAAERLQDIDDSQVDGCLLSGILEFNLHHYHNSEKLLQEAVKRASDNDKGRISDALVGVLAAHAKEAGAAGKYFMAGTLYEEAWQCEPQYPMIGLAAASSYALDRHYKESAIIARTLSNNLDPDVQTQAIALLKSMGKSIQP